jgi:hypothetical protein
LAQQLAKVKHSSLLAWFVSDKENIKTLAAPVNVDNIFLQS